MQKIFHKASTRGSANFGWLKAKYSFSFAHYFNPKRMQFGLLRVLNDDNIAPDKGFGNHPHKNMEIITIPLRGTLQHRDSMGNEGVIKSGEVQVMSAGTGVEHSEFNASQTEEINLLQLWVFPEKEQVKPRYDQKRFTKDDQKNKLLTVVSPKSDNNGEALWVHQQTYFSLGMFDAQKTVSYQLHQASHGTYIFLISGEIEVAGEKLSPRDAIGIWDTSSIEITTTQNSRLLLVEVPMN